MLSLLSRLWENCNHSCQAHCAVHDCMCRCNFISVLMVLSLLEEILPFLLLPILGADQLASFVSFPALPQIVPGYYRDEAILHQRMWFCWFVGCLAGGFVHLFVPPLPPHISDLEMKLAKPTSNQFAMMGVVLLSRYKEKKHFTEVCIYNIPRLLKMKQFIFKVFLFNRVIVTSIN